MPSFFELWRFLGARPSVRLTSAYYRVTVAAEDLGLRRSVRHKLAKHLMNGNSREVEEVIRSGNVEAIEWIEWVRKDVVPGMSADEALAIHQEQWGKMSEAAAGYFRKSYDAISSGNVEEYHRLRDQASPAVQQEMKQRLITKYGEHDE